MIFSSGNSIARVDTDWFTYARDGDVLGVPVKLCAPEEMIWSKAFVQERERFDGADIMDLVYHFGDALDWPRLIARFGPHWRVLFGFVVWFGFVYPNQRHRIPEWVMDELSNRLLRDRGDASSRICNGHVALAGAVPARRVCEGLPGRPACCWAHNSGRACHLDCCDWRRSSGCLRRRSLASGIEGYFVRDRPRTREVGRTCPLSAATTASLGSPSCRWTRDRRRRDERCTGGFARFGPKGPRTDCDAHINLLASVRQRLARGRWKLRASEMPELLAIRETAQRGDLSESTAIIRSGAGRYTLICPRTRQP